MNGTCVNHDDIKELIKANSSDIQHIESHITTLGERIAKAEDSTSSSHKRLSVFEARLEVCERRGEENARIMTCIEYITKQVEQLIAELDSLKLKKYSKSDELLKFLIYSLIGAFAANLGTKIITLLL